MEAIHSVYAAVGRRFRRRRMREFCETFGIDERTRVLDIGGTPSVWDHAPNRPRVTFVNLYGAPPAGMRSGDHYVRGNACALPFADDAFDVAFSNSVIEHVGTWSRQRAFASEVRRVGRSYCVQTPNRSFPIEPHLLGVGTHWLPRLVQRRSIRYTTIWGWVAKPTSAQVDAFLDEVRLLTAHEMRALFPDARIARERVAGLTKSLTAMRLPADRRAPGARD